LALEKPNLCIYIDFENESGIQGKMLLNNFQISYFSLYIV